MLKSPLGLLLFWGLGFRALGVLVGLRFRVSGVGFMRSLLGALVGLGFGVSV